MDVGSRDVGSGDDSGKDDVCSRGVCSGDTVGSGKVLGTRQQCSAARLERLPQH